MSPTNGASALVPPLHPSCRCAVGIDTALGGAVGGGLISQTEENEWRSKAVLASQDEFNALPEAIREHYTEQDGTWVLSLDGPTRREAALGTKVNEFRDTNIALSRERDEATRAGGGDETDARGRGSRGVRALEAGARDLGQEGCDEA